MEKTTKISPKALFIKFDTLEEKIQFNAKLNLIKSNAELRDKEKKTDPDIVKMLVENYE